MWRSDLVPKEKHSLIHQNRRPLKGKEKAPRTQRASQAFAKNHFYDVNLSELERKTNHTLLPRTYTKKAADSQGYKATC